jgi:hypothetical protein
MIDDEEEDTRLLLDMLENARQYLLSFSWCKSILDAYFGNGVGGVIAIFLFHIESTRADVDEWLWVVIGDIPPAYLVPDTCKNPSQALEGYIHEMRKWVDLAKQGCSSPEVIPVNVPSTPEWAANLEGRLGTLEQHLLPMFASPQNIATAKSSEKAQ